MVTTNGSTPNGPDNPDDSDLVTPGGNVGALSEWLASQSGLNPALVELARTLAADLDAKPSASVAREYRMTLTALAGLEVGAADDQATLLELVRTPMGDTKNQGSKDVRAAGRGGRGKSRVAVDAVATPGRGRGRGASA